MFTIKFTADHLGIERCVIYLFEQDAYQVALIHIVKLLLQGMY